MQSASNKISSRKNCDRKEQVNEIMNRIYGIFILIAMFTISGTSLGHEGETHGPPSSGAGTYSGPIRLSPEAKKNLGLKVEDVDMRTIETSVRCFGVVEPVPDKFHFISTRISGRISRVFVNQGDAVKEGDLLAEIESRQIGEPPPTVNVQSTLTGTITERHVFSGEPIEPDKILFKVADLSSIRIKCHVYEADIGGVKMGQKVRAWLEAFIDHPFEGTIDFLGGELEEETRTLPVWCRIDNPTLDLRPNMRATVYLITGAAKDVPAVPAEAILGDSGNYFVYIENGDVYERKFVILGRKDDRYTEITEGLLPGDRVVTQGNYQLQFIVGTEPEVKK